MDTRQNMSGIEKVATVLNVLDKPLASRLLQQFSAEDLEKISSVSGDVGPVSSKEFANLIEEFAKCFSNRLQMFGAQRNIGGLLESVLTPEQVAQISKKDVAVTQSPPVWNDTSFSNQAVLKPLMENEHPQLAAFILSKLDSDVSAPLIDAMETDTRNDIMLRMLKIREIHQEIIALLEGHFRTTFIENPNANKRAEARTRIASIINNLEKDHAEDFILDLSVENPEEAKEIKKLLFGFEDIATLTVKDRLVLFDSVPAELCITALNGIKDAELKELVLSSFGTRMRNMIEAELNHDSGKPTADVVAARRKIANIALKLAASGEITISEPEDET